MLNIIDVKQNLNIIKDIISIQQLQPSYWFRNPGPASFKDILPVLAFFTLIIFTGVLLLIYNRWKIGRYPPKNKIFKPAAIGLILLGISGVVFTLLRSQGITFLGVRFFLLIFILASLLWILYFFYLYRKRLPREIVKYEARALKQKYFSKGWQGEIFGLEWGRVCDIDGVRYILFVGKKSWVFTSSFCLEGRVLGCKI